MSLDELWSADPDDDLLDRGDFTHAAMATTAATAIGRRDELREQITRGITGRLTLADVVILCGIGAIGAIPATSIDDRVLAGLKVALGGGVSVLAGVGAQQARQVLQEKLADGSLTADLSGLAHKLAGEAGGGAIASTLLTKARDSFGGAVAKFAVPDAEDVIETGLTRLLSDKYCEYRGWREGEPAYHQAKTLAYAVTAIVSAPFNPNPVAFALAAWHGLKVIWLTGVMIGRVRELVELAVAAAAEEIAAFQKELARSQQMDEWGRRLGEGDPT